MRTYFRLLTVVALTLLPALVLRAQNQHANQARGFNANGVYSTNDIDSVNVFNGNLVLSIPIGNSYPISSRLAYSLNLFYNSNLWTQREVCDDSVNVTYEQRYTVHASQVLINGVNVTVLEDGGDEAASRRVSDRCYTFNHPNPAANAGMGWQLTLGKLYNPRDGWTDDRITTTERLEYVYQTPDGGEHTFYSTLHVGEADDAASKFWYTRDGSYLRMFLGDASDSRLRIEFPNGERHFFEPKQTDVGTEYRVTRIEDRLGGYITVAYVDDDADQADDRWLIQDSVGRTQEVIFQDEGEHYQNVIKEIKLLAPAEQTATYTFNYEFRWVERATPYVADLQGYPHNLYLPFLTSVVLPDGSQYSAPIASYDLTGQTSGEKYRGIIKSITLPTGANIEWQYEVPGMGRNEGYGYFYPHVASARSYNRSSVGVRRRILTVEGQTYVWKYDPLPEPPPGYPCTLSSLDPDCAPKEFVNTVTTPSGDYTVHYFSVYPHPFKQNGGQPYGAGRTETEWHAVEYGLPLTKHLHGRADYLQDAGSPSKPLFLSTQTYSGKGTPDNTGDDVLVRSEYVRYETDRYPVSDGWGNHLAANARLAVRRTVYHDDVEGAVERFSETRYSNFDGLGHYRRAETVGNFDGNQVYDDDSRSTLVNYNPAQGEYRLDPTQNALATAYTPFPETREWILNRYDQSVTRDNGSNSKAVAEYQFDDRGLVIKRRTYKQTSAAAQSPPRSASDVVAVFDYSPSGNLTRERYYGGDKRADLSTAALPNLTLPEFGYEYGIKHEYAPGGVLRWSCYIRPSGGTHAPISFKSLDRDIDERTGLVVVERDTAGDPTAYTYDAMWRLTRVQPRQGSRTDITYVRRGGALPGGGTAARATSLVLHRPNAGGTALDEEKYEYDGRGHLVMEWMSLPRADGTSYLTSRQTLYNGEGWKTSVSEWGSSQKRTEYLNFDPFGRARLVRSPDGKEVAFQFHGVRRIRRNVWGVMTPSDTSGAGQERNAESWEFYDEHGRLKRVREPSGRNDEPVTTFYSYDEGNRLAGVSTTASVLENNNTTVSNIIQARSLDYDGMGNLLRETHPELGASGGAITYDDHDTKGHVGLRTDGANTLRYTYDVVERLLLLEERVGASYRVLKSYGYYGLYDNRPAENSYVGGKVATAVRHNYIINPTDGQATDVVVTERYEYRGLDGRMSKRRTEVSVGANFEQTFTYGPLGKLISQTYPQCTAETVHCAPVATPRTVGYQYRHGQLSRVFSGGSNYASAVNYHDNGALSEVAYGNNLKDLYGKDPNFMQRVASIRTLNGATNAVLWDTQTYQYDGAGNVHRIGADWYFYDLVGRLREGTVMSIRQKQTYRYDAFANLRQIVTRENVGLSTERVKATQEIDTDAATNRLRNVTYDARGNATGQPGVPMYTYDALNMMKTAPNKVYIYGPTDERIWVADRTGGVQVETVTLRGLSNEVLREYQVVNGNYAGHWGWARDYVYRGDKLVATETPGGRLYNHVDHLGSPRLLTNASGVKVSSHQYFPFGGEDPSLSAQDAERLKFTGHERDTNPGAASLDYMHARYYYYGAGKFMSADPGRDFDPKRPQSWNLYAYVRNNPLNATDPTGRQQQQQGGSSRMYFWDSVGVYSMDTEFNCPKQCLPLNPVSGEFGFGAGLTNEAGHMRSDNEGHGSFDASRRGKAGAHKALDIAGEDGVTPVRAIGGGVVEFVGEQGALGLSVRIRHGRSGVVSTYGHLAEDSIPASVTPGARVARGQKIGLVGTTGNGDVPVPHLHLIVKVNGVRVNPAKFLNECACKRPK